MEEKLEKIGGELENASKLHGRQSKELSKASKMHGRQANEIAALRKKAIKKALNK
jgi:hypothetical protein